MAKLSAYGATKVLELKARNKTVQTFTFVYALRSDGYALIRGTGDMKSGWKSLGKLPTAQRNEKGLRELIRRMGREVY